MIRSIKAVVLGVILAFTACTSSGPSGLFGKKSGHQAYADKLHIAGLAGTELGRQWLAAAEHSLTFPLTINLPYSETGYFAADHPNAAGLVFDSRQGERLTLQLTIKPAGSLVFLELWQAPKYATEKAKLLLSADTSSTTTTFDVNATGKYIVRLQPELLKGIAYTLVIKIGPSLAFPVAPKVKNNIGSLWGVDRDAGARHHEGIDIFAPKRTPLVAAANGTITRVGENNLGGKVIFLSPDDKDYTLYYAHLDEQLATPGQRVTVGDTIGLVGNTGNARTTPSHLHFGVYTSHGAVDPLPFVNPHIKEPQRLTAPLEKLDRMMRASRAVKAENGPGAAPIQIEANEVMHIEAASGSWYKVGLPGGRITFVAAGNLEPLKKQLRSLIAKAPLSVLDAPTDTAATRFHVQAGQSIGMLGIFNDFYYVSAGTDTGWVSHSDLAR